MCWKHTEYVLWLQQIKLKDNKINISENFPNILQLNNTFVNNSLVKEEITKEIENNLIWMKIKSTYHNVWDIAIIFLRQNL